MLSNYVNNDKKTILRSSYAFFYLEITFVTQIK